MTALADILRALPHQETTRPGERVLSWSRELAVVVRDSGEVGQFAAQGKWSRKEVEAALTELLMPPQSRYHGPPVERDAGFGWH